MALDPDTFDQLTDAIRRFVDERLRPLEGQVEEQHGVPTHIVAEMREMGLFGLSIPEEFGGLGLTMTEEVRVVLELGRTTPAFRSVFARRWSWPAPLNKRPIGFRALPAGRSSPASP
jgi:acyl-CoA dehydrogenase